ncbi:hypothetical protein FCN77_16270 [Arthrobacter sp. 24S4-2]|uniref:hypothetical protein n=1 Tax=Arthrobacter sp. 24S4-2 TaxID=2575374 RepID=UPI0010C77661|nr:hypothetical protein [Arthrobacter sp. 24S4-2]QCO98970.1 hypothetical protein FCN77_16270 [Arthrobacter sp. 24S4-2]
MASGRPIEIPITVDADGAEKGVSKVADAFDEVQDSLKDLSKAGDKASKNLESDMSDAAKKIDRDIVGALKDVEDTAKTTGKTVGRDVKAGTAKAGEGFSELKDESKSTAKEAAASFGSIEDAASALQEVAANAFAGFGPAGMAMGALAAVGIGLAMTALTDTAEKTNEAKENMLGLAAEIRDAGGVMDKVDFVSRMQDWGLAVQDTKEWFELWQSDAKSGFDVVKEESRKAGTQWESAFKGAHGTMDDSINFLKDTDAEFKNLNREIDDAGRTYDEFGGSQSNASIETTKQTEALKNQREAAQKNADAVRDANRAAWDAINVGKSENGVLQEQLDLKNHLADANKDAVTSELDLADAQEDLATKLADSNAKVSDNTKESRDNQRAVLDTAESINTYAQSQIDAGASTDEVNAKVAAQRDQLIDQATKFFGSRDAAAAFIDTILKTPKKVDVDVNLNGIPDAEEKLRNFINVGRHISVDVKTGDTSAVDNYVSGMTGGKVFVDFAPRGGRALAP